jgi:hypothetical protein
MSREDALDSVDNPTAVRHQLLDAGRIVPVRVEKGRLGRAEPTPSYPREGAWLKFGEADKLPHAKRLALGDKGRCLQRMPFRRRVNGCYRRVTKAVG